MSLDVKRLEKVRVLSNGSVQSRCPACAETGADGKGEHLRIYPDGRFGCCVHPKDREHRRRVHALAGDNRPRVIEVRVAAVKSGNSVVSGILGRLGRLFTSPTGTGTTTTVPDASDGVTQVQNGLVQGVQSPRTPRTGVSESKQGRADNSRTLRTPLYPEGDKQLVFRDEGEETYKEFPYPVRSVREPEAEMDSAEGVRAVREGGERLPHLTLEGDLVIPFNAPERYHWWNGGQTVTATKAEILARSLATEQS
jgi:hypothetical protein